MKFHCTVPAFPTLWKMPTLVDIGMHLREGEATFEVSFLAVDLS